MSSSKQNRIATRLAVLVELNSSLHGDLRPARFLPRLRGSLYAPCRQAWGTGSAKLISTADICLPILRRRAAEENLMPQKDVEGCRSRLLVVLEELRVFSP